jgi:hypothetical protein
VGLEPAFSQPVNKIIAVARAICGRVKHFVLYMIGTLQVGHPFCGAPGAFALAPQIEQEEGGSQYHQAHGCHPADPLWGKYIFPH